VVPAVRCAWAASSVLPWPALLPSNNRPAPPGPLFAAGAAVLLLVDPSA
jgi:hypothetical protein